MKSFNTLILLVFQVALLSAQRPSEPLRVEFSAKADVFEVVSCGEDGALLFYQSNRVVDDKSNAWVFILYDQNFEAIWSKEIPVFKEFAYELSHVNDGKVYLTFQKTEKPRSDEHNFQMVALDLKTGDFRLDNLFIPEDARLINFQVSQNMMAAGFNYPREKAILIVYDLQKKQHFHIQFTEQPSFIKDLKINNYSNEIFTSVNVYTSKRTSALYVNSYDFEGNLKNSLEVTPLRQEEKLMNGQISFISSDQFFVLGSFNNQNGSASRANENDMGEQSEGFYIARFEGNGQKFIRLHQLLDFKNITEILNNEQLAVVRNLLRKEQKKGKEQSLNYDFLIHDLQKNGDNFLMLAEAFYPQYHQVSTITYDFYGRPMPYYYTIFEGYRFFNAFVVEFDRDGNLIFSNGMKMWEMLSMKLRKNVGVFPDGNDLAIFYNHDGSVVSKVIDGYTQKGTEERTRIATKNISETPAESTQGRIVHWYGNNFLAYGYQTIRNNSVPGGSRRDVFYINKMTFD
jgi:hypothetical protein